jgi:hypothetical protein
MAMQHDEARRDQQGRQAIAAALRLIKEQLYTFGADGDEAIQQLLSAESAARALGLSDVETETFRAFHAGLSAQERLGRSDFPPIWSGPSGLRPAYETGALAARLNARSREKSLASGWNVRPFDHPDVQLALTRATEALGGE